ncbi:hypothetical protein [Rufibacter sp. XAAS-G3-1]|uniref:hypothetical protein n=1 Tax=Rufibacter sp. XAAS-G3-1 TaxID=2729134 RepID=UPI0015E70106|nr:hypothetical protein [Rufibacter sp. XAAS-G3-1]
MIQKYFRTLMAAAVLLTGTLAACNETSELQEVVLPVPAEETAGFPRVPVKVDTTLTLRVLYRPANGCGRFSRVDSVKSTQQTDIRIFAAYPADDQEAICADIAKLVPLTFRFSTTTPGIHRFRFWQADNTYLLDSVEVK